MKNVLFGIFFLAIFISCSSTNTTELSQEDAHNQALEILGITDSYTKWESCVDLGGGFTRLQTFFLDSPNYKRTVIMSTNGYAVTTEAYEGTYGIQSSGFTVESSSGQTEDVSGYQLYTFTPSQKYSYDSGAWGTNTATPFYYIVEQASSTILDFISINPVENTTYSFFGEDPTVYSYTNQSLQ